MPLYTFACRLGFLAALRDGEYQRAHNYIVTFQDLIFKDLSQLFKRYRQEGRMILLVIIYMYCWLNTKPSGVSECNNNTPPLWIKFLPAMQKQYEKMTGIKSMILQKDIIHFILQRYKDFNNITINHYLQEFPDDEENSNYNERFIS
jgi:hypothetical protein